MKKFEIGKYDNYECFNSWFKECQKLEIPYIIIKKKTKYSRIEWDYINLNPKFDILFNRFENDIREHFLNLFRRYACSKSEYLISNLTFSVDCIENEHVEDFAEDLFDYLLNLLKSE